MGVEQNPGRIPEWAKRERGEDLAWIAENLYILWPAAQMAFTEVGRGALFIDTRLSVTHPQGTGNPIYFVPLAEIETVGDKEATRMVRAYDPRAELVTVLLKSRDRESVYRIIAASRYCPS